MSKHHVLIAIIVILLVGLGVVAWQNYSNQQDAKKVASLLAGQDNEAAEEPVDETSTETEEAAPTNLDFEATIETAGASWELVSVMLNQNQVSLNAETSAALNLKFDTAQDSYAGFAGCNTFSGGYTAGAEMAFGFGDVASTKMACSTQAMDLETAIFQAMGKVVKFGMEGTQLYFISEDGFTKLMYKPAA